MTAPTAEVDETSANWASARAGVGDRVFAGAALAAGLTILAALAGVFVFLAIKGASGFTKSPEVYGPHAESFLGSAHLQRILVQAQATVDAALAERMGLSRQQH